MKRTIKNLAETARQLFAEVLLKVDAENALRSAIRLENRQMQIFESVFDLDKFPEIYVIAFGKAGMSMALALNEILAERIVSGVVSAPKSARALPPNWQVFMGGHPLPNKASLAAARAATEILEKANHEQALVIFLVSGGGSAMLELPRDKKITLKDLQAANKILVSCGAPIGEVNAIRRCLSRIKGGGLSKFAPLATQISLIISDTNRGDEANVASGPTIESLMTENFVSSICAIIEKYQLNILFPPPIANALKVFLNKTLPNPVPPTNRSFFTLMDNQTALETIVESAKNLGFQVEITTDLVETPITSGCQELVSRLVKLLKSADEKPVALISGGEFACPVRGTGIGGRNSEATLRCLLEIEKFNKDKFEFAILNAGTDGIDGNSPATGATADNTTLARAKSIDLNATEFLANSDTYTFFATLDDTIITGTTGTNVRDVRILLTQYK